MPSLNPEISNNPPEPASIPSVKEKAFAIAVFGPPIIEPPKNRTSTELINCPVPEAAIVGVKFT